MVRLRGMEDLAKLFADEGEREVRDRIGAIEEKVRLMLDHMFATNNYPGGTEWVKGLKAVEMAFLVAVGFEPQKLFRQLVNLDLD